MKIEPAEILEDVLTRILSKTGACNFEVIPPLDASTRWEMVAYADDKRWTALGRDILEAAQRLETKMTVTHREAD